MRVMSRLPVSVVMAEPHPDPGRPGDSPVLRQAVLRPGVNDIDGDLFKAWTADGVAGAFWLASPDDIKSGLTDGKIYEMSDSEPDAQYGFEVALKRVVDAGGSDASEGSTIKDASSLSADDMRTGSPDATPVAPVLVATAPLKVPVTSEAPAVAPVAKTQPSAATPVVK